VVVGINLIPSSSARGPVFPGGNISSSRKDGDAPSKALKSTPKKGSSPSLNSLDWYWTLRVETDSAGVLVFNAGEAKVLWSWGEKAARWPGVEGKM
jgi:hypothetical protein